MKTTRRSLMASVLAIVYFVCFVSYTQLHVTAEEGVSIDFSSETHQDSFSTTYGGWSVANGVYQANTAWANTYLKDKINLSTDKSISFDFSMQSDTDPAHQFNFGLVDVNADPMTTTISGHFYYSSEYGEVFSVNRAFGNPTDASWIASDTTNFNDDNIHTAIIEIKGGKASISIDDVKVCEDVALEADSAYLMLQFTSTTAFADNLKIEIPATQDPNPDVPSSGDTELDFSTADDGDNFSTTYGGWSVSNGVYKANTAWANTYLNGKISLTEEKEIRFDFCLVNNGDQNHQFNIGFVDINNDTITTDVSGHFYCHSQYGELFTLNKDFGNPIGEGWIADCTTNYNDGKIHSMLIQIKNKKMTIYIDKVAVFENIDLNMDSAHFIMQATSVDSYIDNFKLSSELTDPSGGTDNPENPTENPTESPAGSTTESPAVSHDEIFLTFDHTSDGDHFIPFYLGWSVVDGVYKPNGAWASSYLNKNMDLTGKTEISFDFCLKNNNDQNHQFNIGFVTVSGDVITTDVSGHFYNNAQYGELFTLNKDFGNPIGEGWIADCTTNYNDGKVHSMRIQIQNKKMTIYIDKVAVFENIELKMNSASFVIQATSVDSYIDHFKLSNKLDDSSGYASANNGVKKTSSKKGDLALTFSNASDGNHFITYYLGWSVVDGVYKPNDAWATAYLDRYIDLTGEKEIRFDFCLRNNNDQNHQFNFGLIDISNQAITTDVSGHFYNNAQYGELFTINRDFGNPIGDGWIADCTTNYNDGNVHTLLIRIKDKKMSIYIDEIEVFKDIDLKTKSAYFIIQATSVDTYIDNFKFSNKLTYMPDYPTSTPDPTYDEAYSGVRNLKPSAALNGNVVKVGTGSGAKGHLFRIILLDALGFVLVVLLVVGVMLFEKKKGKANG